MEGKVKCTCGWSWNKSDSSKKDMYVCHECGRDNSNNMRNGGWLDNYNDSQVSFPEGFVGEGILNGPKFDNPAWGGQFEEGGKIPIAQKGEKVKYVESKNDPRYRAYQDSLSLHNESINDLNILKKMKSSGKAIDFLENRFESGEPRKNNRYPMSQKGEKSFNSLKKLNKKEPKPTYQKIKYDGLFGLESSITTPIYKKPKQKVIVGISPEEALDKEYGKGKYYKEPVPKEITQKEFDRINKNAKSPFVNRKGIYSNDLGEYYKINNKKQQVIVKPKVVVQPDLPRVEAVNLPPMQQLQSIDAPTISDVVRSPKSYNVSAQRYNMQGPSDYYNYNKESVDYETAMKVKAASDYYNKTILEKYGPQNEYRTPKSAKDAAERLKQLKSEFEITPNYQMGGSIYPVNYVPEAQMGGSIPGSVGFTYARTNDPAPSNGPYAKKTKASAKNGNVIKDDRGQWAHPGEITEIGSNQITMQGVPYPVLGISDTGDMQMMYPEEEYEFDGEKVTEFPMAKNGLRQEQKGLVNLDNLLNFTNYNTKQPGGWLDTL